MYNCRPMCRPIGTHPYTQNFPKNSIKLYELEFLTYSQVCKIRFFNNYPFSNNSEIVKNSKIESMAELCLLGDKFLYYQSPTPFLYTLKFLNMKL